MLWVVGLLPQAAAALPPGLADAWDGLLFGEDAFEEVIELAEAQHVVTTLPSRAWVAAAAGAMSVMRPRVELLPDAFIRQERVTIAGRKRLSGPISILPCAARPKLRLRLHRPDTGRPGTIGLVADLRARRLQRAAWLRRLAVAWERVPFDKAAFRCVMAHVQARLRAKATPLPAGVTPTAGLTHTSWRTAASFFLRAMDPHCDVLPNRFFERLEEQASGYKMVDVGITFVIRKRRIVVRRVHPRGPAVKLNIRGGDRLVAVAGKKVAGMDLDAVERLIEGKADTKVTLRLKRRRRTRLFKIARAEVRRSTVTGYLVHRLGGKSASKQPVAVLRLPQFAENAGKEVAEEITRLAAEAGRALVALVVDMRGNTGGWVDEAAAVADLLLAGGQIVTVRSRRQADKVYKAAPSAADLKLPVVLLIDGGCRSSCELVAAALRENGRALAVGAPTWGKGSVQGVFDALSGPWSILLTIAKYYGPSGRSLQALGVLPDVPLAAMVRKQAGQRREADLSTHLVADTFIKRPDNPLLTPQLKACAAAGRASSAPLAGLPTRDAAMRAAVEHALCLTRAK